MNSTQAVALLGALMMTTAGEARQRATQPVPINPEKWFSADDYPPSTIRAGLEGEVEYRVFVDDEGRALSCTIHRSSGVPALDKQTCASALLNARFEPGHNAKGVASAGTYEGLIKWKLPTISSDGEPMLPWRSIITIALDTSGSLESCGTTFNGVSQQPNWKACENIQDMALHGNLIGSPDAPYGLIVSAETIHEYVGQSTPGDRGEAVTEISRKIIRFRVNSSGEATDCREESIGEGADPSNPCMAKVRFDFSKAVNGNATIEGTWSERIGWRRRLGINDS